MTPLSKTTRPVEAEAFLAALQDVSPKAMTACSEWTAHDIGAHLAGTYEEVTRHLRAYSEGLPLATTRSFEEREAPFKRLAPAELLAVVERGEETMRSEIAAILAGEPDAVFAWTRRQMRVDAFLTHLRSECAIHRWDLLGDDDTSWELLGQFELLKHAVTAIGAGPMTARGAAGGVRDETPLLARLRSDGHPDLLVTFDATVRIEAVDQQGEATLCADEPARLLVLWGRTPSPATRVLVSGRPDEAWRVRRLLSGY